MKTIGCEVGYTCLSSDNPNTTITLDIPYTVETNIFYVELISASDTAATIGVFNDQGGEELISKEITEETSKVINGLNVYLKSANENNGFFNVVLQLSLATTCTDSDGGKNYYVKGNTTLGNDTKTDYCRSTTSEEDVVYAGNILKEFYCATPNNIGAETYDECPNGCVDGACVSAVNYTGTCSELVNQIANPSDFEDNGIKYYYSGWKYSYNGTWWEDGKEFDFTEYHASWSLNYQDGNNYKYGYLSKNVMVFDNESFDTLSILEEMTNSRFCQIHSYYDEDDDSDKKIYVCNWNVYNEGVNIDQYNWKNREILWAHDNILVRFSIGVGKWLSDEEINKIMEKETINFINSLKDNQGKYLGWENFDIDWPFSDQLFDSLEMCPSDVPTDACSPYWQCITEPAICPEHGFQTQTCKDYGCGNKDSIYQISCNPGICSGCLVPKWFDSDMLGQNRCIPYGFRFESQIGWTEGTETAQETDTLRIGDLVNDNDLGLNIFS